MLRVLPELCRTSPRRDATHCSKLRNRNPTRNAKVSATLRQDQFRRKHGSEGRLVPTRQFVENLIDIELAYINTKHPEFAADAAMVGLMKREENRPVNGEGQREGTEGTYRTRAEGLSSHWNGRNLPNASRGIVKSLNASSKATS
ncbi:hypothetical protein L596_015830 [Steinernema carpocapsae]|uniref:Dynamin stalk domain-containing protein n=1 Tax=Steinernema carpocapsae TaxID=34508 RepID=A0A4U5NH74_STECR|nr:hypothetical protein L596_015830 [Steinernema carpocapsae]